MKKFLLLLSVLFISIGSVNSQIKKVILGEYTIQGIDNSNRLKAVSQRVAGSLNIEDYGLSGILGGKGLQYGSIVFDSLGRVYRVTNGLTSVQVPNDINGNSFTGIWKVGGTFEQKFAIKSDSSIWYWGTDHFGFLGRNSDTPRFVPNQGGRKFREVEAATNTTFSNSLTRLWGITKNDSLIVWTKGSLTPSVPNFSFQGKVKFIGGNPYGEIVFTNDSAWVKMTNQFYDARQFGYPTASIGSTNYVNITTQLKSYGVAFPIKELLVQYTGTKIIDANDNLWSCGASKMGEVGNGVAFQFWRSQNYSGDITSLDSVQTLVQIPGKFRNLCGSNTVSPATLVQDLQGNWYFWGRNKATACPFGESLQPYIGYKLGVTGAYDVFPNYLDVASPVKISPFSSSLTIISADTSSVRYPSVWGGVDRQVSVDSVRLYGGWIQQQPLSGTVTATNVWSVVSKPNGSNNPSFSSTTVKSPLVTGLVNGQYVFRNTVTNSSGLPSNRDVTVTVSINISSCDFTYGSWSTCNNGVQTRPYVSSPSGCIGTPPTDSITRSCTVPCRFAYGSWSTTCVNGLQTRTYTASPSGCIGVPPTDSIQRACQPCTFTYSAWSTCTSGAQTRTYTASPSNCVGIPPADSLRRTCTSVIISNFSYDSRRTRIYIKCNVSGTMVIRNAATGATVQTSNYAANGVYISVSGLTSRVKYTATTYGRSLTFTR